MDQINKDKNIFILCDFFFQIHFVVVGNLNIIV